jgi:hypothetical protein
MTSRGKISLSITVGVVDPGSRKLERQLGETFKNSELIYLRYLPGQDTTLFLQ